jgi:hypothetical protein
MFGMKMLLLLGLQGQLLSITTKKEVLCCSPQSLTHPKA